MAVCAWANCSVLEADGLDVAEDGEFLDETWFLAVVGGDVNGDCWVVGGLDGPSLAMWAEGGWGAGWVEDDAAVWKFLWCVHDLEAYKFFQIGFIAWLWRIFNAGEDLHSDVQWLLWVDCLDDCDLHTEDCDTLVVDISAGQCDLLALDIDWIATVIVLVFLWLTVG